MKEAPFQFKQFSISHGLGLKLTTDAVFFGAWASLSGNGSLLDMGTGTGILALMAAQRYKYQDPIDAIELSQDAYKCASENFKNSPWAKRLHAYHTSVVDFVPTRLYQDIICNPPFFVEAIPRQNAALREALHADAGLLERWMKLAHGWLAPEGRLHLMVLPTAHDEVSKLAKDLGLYIFRHAYLHHSKGHPAMRYLVTLTRHQTVTPEPEVWPIYLPASRHMEEAYHKLVEGFYLKL